MNSVYSYRCQSIVYIQSSVWLFYYLFITWSLFFVVIFVIFSSFFCVVQYSSILIVTNGIELNYNTKIDNNKNVLLYIFFKVSFFKPLFIRSDLLSNISSGEKENTYISSLIFLLNLMRFWQLLRVQICFTFYFNTYIYKSIEEFLLFRLSFFLSFLAFFM